MSSPTRALASLSIKEKMPKTRSQAQRERRLRERQQGTSARFSAGSATAGSAAQGRYTDNTLIEGHTGILYDVRNLSPAARTRAVEGLNSDKFTVDHSRKIRSAQGTYYAFQLKKPESIRIYDSSNGSRRVTCTCEDFTQSSYICAHIYWLFDGLNKVLSSVPRHDTHVVTPPNVVSGISNLYDKIGERHDSLTRELNNSQFEFTATESDDSASETSFQADDYGASDYVVQDILSVLDPDLLPNGYGPDFLKDIPNNSGSLRGLVVPGNMPATIFALARYDEEFRRRLCAVMDKDFCATKILEKIETKLRESFGRLDRYVTNGPITKHGIVNESAEDIRELVSLIKKYVKSRSPLSPQVRAKGAEIAVNLLSDICDRNVDIYGQITWTRDAGDPESEDDRNLYINLIGRRSSNDDSDDDDYDNDSDSERFEDYLIIDTLAEFSPQDWVNLLDRLDTILVQLRSNQAPSAYINRLQGMVDDCGRQSNDPFRNVGTRPRPQGQSDRQRRRIG